MDESHNGPHAGKGGFSTRSQEYAMSRSFVDPLPLKIYPYLLVPLIISLTIFILCLTSIHMLKNATAMFCCSSPSRYKPRLSPSFLITISLLSFHVSCVASEENEANSIRLGIALGLGLGIPIGLSIIGIIVWWAVHRCRQNRRASTNDSESGRGWIALRRGSYGIEEIRMV